MTIRFKPTDTDGATTSAYISGPNGVLVELYQRRK
jgi:hypothetical protein